MREIVPIMRSGTRRRVPGLRRETSAGLESPLNQLLAPVVVVAAAGSRRRADVGVSEDGVVDVTSTSPTWTSKREAEVVGLASGASAGSSTVSIM